MEPSEQERHPLFFDTFLLPVEVAFNKKLDKNCHIVFCLIRLLDNHKKHCIASNTYMANILDTSIKTISDSIATLKEQGYIELLNFDGRTRVLQIKKSYKTEYRHLVDEVELRLLNLKSAYTESSRQPNADQVDRNEQTRKDVLGSVEGNFSHNKSKEETDKIDVSHSVFSGNEVPTKKKIVILTKKEIMQKAQSNLVPHITKPKPFPKIVISKPVQEVLDYWNKVGLKAPADKTWSLKTAVEDIEKVIDGTMFKDYDHPDFKPWKNRKFPVREIKQAIDIYFLRAHSPQYLPTKKDYLQKLTLSTFFYNRYTSSGLFASEFLTCWAKPLEKTTENKLLAMEDRHPELTKILTSWYRSYFAEPKGFSIKDRNNIIKATRKIVEFVNNCNGNIVQWQHEVINPNIFVANCLVDAMKDMLRNNEGFYPMFESSWLASDTTFNERLPKYMRKENKLR